MTQAMKPQKRRSTYLPAIWRQTVGRVLFFPGLDWAEAEVVTIKIPILNFEF